MTNNSEVCPMCGNTMEGCQRNTLVRRIGKFTAYINSEPWVCYDCRERIAMEGEDVAADRRESLGVDVSKLEAAINSFESGETKTKEPND